jgi:hypothetical protein
MCLYKWQLFPDAGSMLYNVHNIYNNDRYFLRGMFHRSYKTNYTLYFDILPLTREIVLKSARNMYILPEVRPVRDEVGMRVAN